MQAKDTLSRVRAEDYEEATVERMVVTRPGIPQDKARLLLLGVCHLCREMCRIL